MTGWILGYSDRIDEAPSEFVTAYVPSDVQLVWKEQKNMPDYNFGKNYLEYKWMEDKFWHYRIALDIEHKSGFVPFLVFKSIDYRYTITVNEKIMADGEGMFTPVRIDLSEFENTPRKDNATAYVEVIIHPIPKIPGMPETREQAALSCKPPVSYGWDWHPRLVPSGISDDAYIEYLPESRISEADFQYTLSDDFSYADFTAKVKFANVKTGYWVMAEIFDTYEYIVAGKGTKIFSEISESFVNLNMRVENPELWWCKGHGKQYLYTYSVSIFDTFGNLIHCVSRKIGFRRAKLKMNADDWSNGGFPATQSYYPITMELNGRQIFCKGTNFVPTEIFYSRMTEDVYRRILTLADECNMNILRVWGGGLTNREPFFDICDELGIMVWQEFPLACNNYPDDAHYLSVLDKESVSIIKRVKSHPSLVMWCGGNELFNGWSGMTNQSLALRLLDKNCLEHDPLTPFMMTSPLYGMGHGCYLNITTNGCDAVTDFVERYRTAYTEFGAPSPAPFEYIRQYIPEDELYKVEVGTSWEDHHAFNAWIDVDTWFRPSEIEAFYGKQDSLEKLIECGLELQGQSYKGMFEEPRRKWPRTSMAINWCFNEPWPCFANNSLVMYPDVVRPAYFDVKESLRDRMISVRVHKLRFKKGEKAMFELFALNDSASEMTEGNVRLSIKSGDKIIDLGTYEYGKIPAMTSHKFAEVEYTIPDDIAPVIELQAIADNASLSSVYKLYIK